MAVDRSKYVVLDLETNGLSAFDDVLSISIYKPDDGALYNKFLSLEHAKQLNPSATRVNGITERDLVGATPLVQRDVNDIINKFELDRRIILTYSEFDKKILKHYFERRKVSVKSPHGLHMAYRSETISQTAGFLPKTLKEKISIQGDGQKWNKVYKHCPSKNG